MLPPKRLLYPVFLILLAGCPSSTIRKEISKEHAIEIARAHVNFQPKTTEAEKATEDGREVWRVTFRGESVSQIHLHPQTMIVTVDRKTGEIVSLSKS